ncbi:MAG: ferritin [Crocinitomicaceae bacterium]|nr:ferritin [Crocinitomicaceae bacterium]
MMKEKVEKALNDQIRKEGESSQFYLAMASWAEAEGLEGTSNFMYKQSDEERFHMLKLVKFVNERGGKAIIPGFDTPPTDFESVLNVFELLLKHEIQITESINDLVEVCLNEKDYPTHNFIQWYLSEQLEEEASARTILDKVKLVGNDKAGLYMFDRDLETITVTPANTVDPGA